MLFAKASSFSAINIKKALDAFCGASGLRISAPKSRILFSSMRSTGVKRAIKEILGFEPTAHLGKYLGVPLFSGRISPRSFPELFDNVTTRLASWEAKLLSMVGRTTLIQSVTSALPNHIMQAHWLPTSTWKTLDMLNRNFLWCNDMKRENSI